MKVNAFLFKMNCLNNYRNMLAFLILLIYSVALCEQVFADELSNLIIIHRHGDRTPIQISAYPNDPYKDVKKLWPEGLGNLTKKGMKGMYNLGRYIKKRYGSFLPNTTDEIYSLSGPLTRHQQSAHYFLLGAFDKLGEIIKINADKISQISFRSNCMRFNQEYNKTMHSPEYLAVFNQYKDIIGYLSEKSGKNLTTLRDIHLLFDSFHAVKEIYGLPKWVTREIYERLSNVSFAEMSFFVYTRLAQRLFSGTFFKELSYRFNATINKESPIHFEVYSTSDNIIISILKSLDSYKSYPHYCSAIIFELHRKNIGHKQHSYYVIVYYFNKFKLEKLSIPRCDKVCDFNDFYSYIHDFIPTNINEECNSKDTF